jgi:hypothetical protein
MRANECLSIRLSNDGSDQRSWISPDCRTVYLRKQIKKVKEALLKGATAKDGKRRTLICIQSLQATSNYLLENEIVDSFSASLPESR